MQTIIPLLIIIGSFLIPKQAPKSANIDALEAKIASAALRWDEENLRNLLPEVRNLRETLASDDAKARLHYLEAYAFYKIIIMNYGNVEDRGELVTQLSTSLEQAEALNYKPVDTYILKSMFKASSLPPGKAHEAAKPLIEKARTMRSNAEADAIFAEATAKIFEPEGAAELFKKAVSTYKSMDLGQNPIQEVRYWEAQAILADIYNGSFRQKPDYERSMFYIDQIRQNRPQMGYYRHILSAYNDTYIPVNEEVMLINDWTGVTEDTVSDAADPGKMMSLQHDYYGIFDAKSLSFQLLEGDLWFKIEYDSLPEGFFGLNLLFDVDNDVMPAYDG